MKEQIAQLRMAIPKPQEIMHLATANNWVIVTMTLTFQREMKMVVVIMINVIVGRYSAAAVKDGDTWSLSVQVYL